MAGLRVLLAQLEQIEAQVSKCKRCGLCQAVCPVFAVSGREADVARGKMALLDGLARQLLRQARGVQERLDRCLLCGACEAQCPSGVPAMEIFFQARAALSNYLGLPAWKRVLLRGFLARPRFFNRMLAWGARVPGRRPALPRPPAGSCFLEVPRRFRDRQWPSLAPVPWHRQGVAAPVEAGPSGLRVAFFTGCLIDKVYPGVADAVVKILRHHGVGLFLPPDQGCCGIPALAAGDWSSFEPLVRHHLQLWTLDDFDYLITACATCTATLRQFWPRLAGRFSPAEQAAIQAIGARTRDIHEFLVEQLGEQGLTAAPGGGVRVTYHDPCHLKQSLGVTAQPRAVLQAAVGVAFQEMTGSGCCGCGGSFALEHYGAAAAMGRRRVEDILASGSAVVATGCPACMLHLGDMLAQAGAEVGVQHVVELYARSLSD